MTEWLDQIVCVCLLRVKKMADVVYETNVCLHYSILTSTRDIELLTPPAARLTKHSVSFPHPRTKIMSRAET